MFTYFDALFANDGVIRTEPISTRLERKWDI